MARATHLNSIELFRDDTIVLDFSMALVEGTQVAIVNGIRRTLAPLEDIGAHLDGLDLVLVEAGYPKVSDRDRRRAVAIRDVIETMLLFSDPVDLTEEPVEEAPVSE